ncbi:hypothetical protein [Streptomyces beihaiensis]|uniref:Translation initiation factor IF-2 n=1 Tax=Streptomyces beihaiensis TaxID=2984495 RepID=A0ABT3TRF0_9ACTN|nr:hypothetical protein [Streptomyces beihaiensis]MCX3059615.1 hypothetical protein [Streptomyces beihaiensis]
MILAIVASVLGGIMICGGLFLRRLLGEIAELRRQITRCDRQMRAQRARENFLRQLLAQDEDDDRHGDDPLPQRAVANGYAPITEPQAEVARPVRRKGHLGLHIGGIAAALTSVTTIVRQALRLHTAQATTAVAGVAVTSATAALITMQPWSAEDSEAPASAPTGLASPYTRPTRHQTSPTPSSSPTTGALTQPPSPDSLPSVSPSEAFTLSPFPSVVAGSPDPARTAPPRTHRLSDQHAPHGRGSRKGEGGNRGSSPKPAPHGQSREGGHSRPSAPPGQARGRPKPGPAAAAHGKGAHG